MRTPTVIIIGSLVMAVAMPAATTFISPATPTETQPVISTAATSDTFRSSDAAYGVTNSESVRNLQRRLIATGHATLALIAAGPTGNYYSATQTSVTQWQIHLGYAGADADGIIGRQSATALGLTWITMGAPPSPNNGSNTITPAQPQPRQAALSGKKLKRVLSKAGFRGAKNKTAWAIVMRESRAYPSIVGPPNTDGTRDYGLFQLNDVHRSHADFSQIYNPKANARIAYQLTNKGTDFSAWGIGYTGWAGHLHKKYPRTWQNLQDELNRWKAKYPAR